MEYIEQSDSYEADKIFMEMMNLTYLASIIDHKATEQINLARASKEVFTGLLKNIDKIKS